MQFGNYVAYVDESGDHSLDSIDAEYPIFALTFCIFTKPDYRDVVCPLVQNFKFTHFGHESVVLHEHAIRKQTPPFAFLKSRPKREAFMQDLNAVVERAPMTIVAAVIDKERLTRK